MKKHQIESQHMVRIGAGQTALISPCFSSNFAEDAVSLLGWRGKVCTEESLYGQV
jgi:hypothetical protein